jgi:hypothetical protein
VWRKCHYLIQESELWRYNHYIWCGGNVTTLFKKVSCVGTTIMSGVEEMSLPYSRKWVVAEQPLRLVWRKCHYLIQESELWRYNHYFWCGGNVTTLLKKVSCGGTTITSCVEEMSLPYSRKWVVVVQPLHLVWRTCHYPIQESESWWYNHYICYDRIAITENYVMFDSGVL